MFNALFRLTSSALRELAAAMDEGSLSHGMSSHAVRQIVGPSSMAEVNECLSALLDGGWGPKQVAVLASTIADVREEQVDPEKAFDLVLSGPPMPGVSTRDTTAVMHTMIEASQEEVILVGYAVHKGRRLFERLAERMSEAPHLKVWFCLNIPRPRNDTSLDSEIVRRFAREFTSQHWPWEPRPELFYDPRSLQSDRTERASLHAKCLVVDRKVAMITSANFTEAAQQRNIEVGVVVEHSMAVRRLAAYFDALRSSLLKPCALA